MANKIADLTAASTPLVAGDELWVEQGGLARRVDATDLGGGGVSPLTINLAANNPSIINIGEDTTLRGDSQDSILNLFGESGGAIRAMSISNNGVNMGFNAGTGEFQFIGGRLVPAASVSGGAGFQILEGSAPSSPDDGDMWVTSGGGFFVRLNGSSVDLAAGGGEINDLTSAVTWANIPIGNVPTGTTSSTVSLGNHTHQTFDHSASLSGATVFDEVDVTNGIVTGIATRNLTAANIGAATSGHTHTGSTISALDAGDTTTGTFSTSRIPNLAASKITSGTFANNRISSGSVTQHLGDYANWSTSGQNDAQMTVSTSAASGGANGDIHFRHA